MMQCVPCMSILFNWILWLWCACACRIEASSYKIERLCNLRPGRQAIFVVRPFLTVFVMQRVKQVGDHQSIRSGAKNFCLFILISKEESAPRRAASCAEKKKSSPPPGFDPATPCLEVGCSPNYSTRAR